MKLYIKYMVSNRCKTVVKTELTRLGLHFVVVDLGEVEVMEELTTEQHDSLKNALMAVGLELMDDRRGILVERIKNTIIELVHHSEDGIRVNFSVYLSEKLNHQYTYLANLFSEMQGTTIEQFMIRHKVERIKELILYDELNITEISLKMDYSSVAHLSNQFKKITGLSPSQFKNLKDKRRSPLETIGLEKELPEDVSFLSAGSVEHETTQASVTLKDVIDLQNMFTQVPIAICILTEPNYTVKFANHLYLQIVQKGNDLIGKSILTSFPDLEAQGVIRLLDQAVETGVAFETKRVELEQCKNEIKKVSFFDFFYQPLLDTNGKIGGFIVIANEVTDRKQADQAAMEHNTITKNLLMKAPTFVCTMVGPDHVFDLVNEQYQRLFGKRQIHGVPIMDALPELAGQGFDSLLDKVYQTGEPYLGIEIPITLARDVGLPPELRYFNFSYQAMYHEDQSINGILCFGHEVTEHVTTKNTIMEEQEKLSVELEQTVEQQAQELDEFTRLLVQKNHEIEISKEKLLSEYSRRLIEASLDPLIVLSTEGKITDVNQAMVAITDVPRDKLIGSDFSIYFTNPSEAKRIYKEIFNNKSVSNYPLTVTDHKLTDVLFNGSVYKDDKGKILGAVVVARDYTEQKRIANELNEARIFAELATGYAEEAQIKAEANTILANEAVKSKQQFLSNMSHEIRTPMNAIIGFTKVMMKTELTDKQREYLTAIKLSGDALIVLINDILDLAKVDAGKMTFENKPFRLDVSIAAMLHIFEPKIQEKNLLLVKNYDPRIPNVLLGDPVRLHQIILNLVSNAVKFTSSGQITVGLKLIAETDNSAEVEFSVADTGIGILSSNLKNIFDNFQQASSSTARLYGGTGLGLAIVKKLVEAQGGRVWVESEKDKGSTFSFTLNFLKTSHAAYIETTREDSNTEVKNTRVLVVEDMALNQLLMKTLLDEFGFERDIAENGKIAIQKMQTKTYDIILMDLQMPVMNGFETTDYIRNVMHSEIPIIALTADVTTVDLERCTAIGMNDYIAKPVDERILYAKIIGLVKKSASEKLGAKSEKSIEPHIHYTNLDYLYRRTKANKDLLIEIISVYLEQTPPLVLSMKASFQSKDWHQLYSAVHKLIPSFAIMGLGSDFEQMAKNVQAFASNPEETPEIPVMIDTLEKVLNQSCDELLIEMNILKKSRS